MPDTSFRHIDTIIKIHINVGVSVIMVVAHTRAIDL